MAQNDQNVADGVGSAVRADINSQLEALITNSSGATEPSTTWAYQFWADTTTGLLKIRNAADDDWIVVASLDDYQVWSGNGIYNGKMTISQRGDYTSPTAITNGTYYLDRWTGIESVVAATIQNTGAAIKVLSTSAATGYMGSGQTIEDFEYYQGKTVTISAYVTSNSSDARLLSWEGATTVASSAHSGGGGEELLTITRTLGGGITTLIISGRVSTSTGGNTSIAINDYISISDVRLDLGEHRLSGDREYGDELALCKRYFQIFGSSGIEQICNGSFYTSTLWLGALIYPVEMRTAPTLSYSAASDFTTEGNASSQASSALSLTHATSVSSRLDVTTAASTQGVGATLSANAGKWLSLSAEL